MPGDSSEIKGERVGNNAIIGQLRVIFAKISLEKLEPDLVIMDEFRDSNIF